MGNSNKKLFWACFIALMATSFGFMIRALLITEWGKTFNLTNTQMGQIMGVGLWPFAITIVLFSLIIDKIGYGRAMIFAFICHIASAIITISANGYTMLYIGTFIVALGNGTVEAVINPAVATIFPENKTKWLNILHAGWPAGFVLVGLLALAMGPDVHWQIKVGLIFIPIIIYGIMMLRLKFPVNERVQAGVPYLDMLKEVGIIGALIIVSMMVMEVGNVFDFSTFLTIALIVVIVGVYGFFVRTLGQPLFIFLLLIMFPLATTELGIDSWIVDLMTPEMKKLGLEAGWLLVYTSAIMMVCRFFAGTFVKKLTPLGLLAVGSALAAGGLMFLSVSTGILILIAATIYGFAKSFFWPTMIGIVGERFPKGGALTLNITTGVGMIGVGIVGAVFLGFAQDKTIDRDINSYDLVNNTQLHVRYLTDTKKSILGEYKALNQQEMVKAEPEEKKILENIKDNAKKGALKSVAILPVIMLICYVVLMIYFKSKGGYKHVDISEA